MLMASCRFDTHRSRKHIPQYDAAIYDGAINMERCYNGIMGLLELYVMIWIILIIVIVYYEILLNG